MRRLLPIVAFAACAALAVVPPAAAQATVFVDATDARRGVFHSRLTLPVAPGAQTLVYPKWIPGEHTPTGPVMQVAGLHVHAGDREVAWSRDRVDMFAFHLDVPAGAQAVTVDFDYLSPASTFGGGYGESPNATQNLVLILFNQLVLYPAGSATDLIQYRASVRLPAGWKFETALPVSGQQGDQVEFAPVSLTTLVDSPIVAGANMRIVPIADSGAERLVIAADSASALALPEARVAQLTNLVAETDALFGARHYRTYRWLVTLSDLVMVQGLEHHECTDIRSVERAFTDSDWTSRTLSTLSHEFVHSWNGKYRRPAGLATPDFQAPMIGELLWVYEGMTRYLGDFVLTGRSGLRTPEEDREYAAYVAASQDRNRPGRTWRPLVDTAVAVSSLSEAPSEQLPYRRGFDYYDEMLLGWLDVDATIRAKSGGAKSLDDFAKVFFGAPSGTPQVKPYSFDDVLTALNQVVPNDWRAFIQARVYRQTEHPPLAALEAAGWRLGYDETPNSYEALRERSNRQVDVSFSLGMWVNADGTIADVVFGGPAYAAGLTPGMKIASIDGRTFSPDVVHEQIRAAKGTTKPIEIAAHQATFAGTFRIEYHDGERHPHLQRLEVTPDMLSDIIRPHRR